MRSGASRLARLAAAGFVAVYWGLLVLGGEFVLDPPGVLYDLWYSSTPWIIGIALAFLTGLYVASWWLLGVAMTPVIVLGVLELTGHQNPWHDGGPPLTRLLWWPLLWALFWFLVLPLFSGVAIRRGLGERGVSTGGGWFCATTVLVKGGAILVATCGVVLAAWGGYLVATVGNEFDPRGRIGLYALAGAVLAAGIAALAWRQQRRF